VCVIPTLSMNALSAADLKGNAVIAITEGLLSRLTRPQIEAVIAHEAHHILSGDCLETTVAQACWHLSALVESRLKHHADNNSSSCPLSCLVAAHLKQCGEYVHITRTGVSC